MADLYVVSVTGKIFKDGKVLIVQRSLEEKNYPGKWILPGGKIEYSDYSDLAPNKDGLWYWVIEKALRREIQEEVGVEVGLVERTRVGVGGTMVADGDELKDRVSSSLA